MQIRRSLALVSGALLLTTTLGSCGFDPASNRVNNVSAGTTDRDTTLDVLNAVVVSAEEGSGTFVATFVNNDGSEAVTLESIAPDDVEAVQIEEIAPIKVDANGVLNLAGEGEEGIPVQGDVSPGGVVALTMRISGGQVVQLEVPVVPNCGDYEGLDGTGGECEIAEPVGEH